MDLTTLRTEVYARGHDALNDGGAGQTRVTRWINEALHEINGLASWPYLETTSSGTAPLAISNVRHVLTVTNNTTDARLEYVSKDVLEGFFPDLPDTGSPSYWYFNSTTQIGVYPANTTDTIEVLFIKNGADLSTGSDTPDMPTRYQGLIVELAAYRGYLHRDNPEIAQNLRAHVDRQLGQMQAELLVRSSESDFILPSGEYW